MKILTWMQNKLNGRYGNKKRPNPSTANINHARQEHCKEEFSDWPHGLLAIGTLGNGNNIENNSKHTHLQENPPSSQELLQELTPEEEDANHQDELDLILLKQVGIGSTCDNTELRLEENMGTDESDYKDCHLQRSPCIVTCSRDYKRLDKPSGAINKKSLSFLVKKILVCGTGFTPTPSLRDHQVVRESRLEKILRAIIHKAIYPQNTTAALSTAKYLENKQKTVPDAEGDVNDKADDGSKWVKTDSEYIVLEI